jgi:DNA-binding NarL/FixJ family response regulator
MDEISKRQRVRVVVVAEPAMAEQLAADLGAADGLSVVTAGPDPTGAALVSADVVLIDIDTTNLPAVVSAGAAAGVVVLAPTLDDERLSSRWVGRVTVVVRDAPKEDVVRAVQAAAVDPRPAVDAHLTARQEEVLILMSAGLLNKQIARRLGLSESTVKAHVTRVFRALGVSSRTAAAEWARSRGLN